MLSMILLRAIIYYYLVKVHHYKLISVVLEHVVHYIHESSWCIRETKREDWAFVVYIASTERCIRYNFFGDSRSMITTS